MITSVTLAPYHSITVHVTFVRVHAIQQLRWLVAAGMNDGLRRHEGVIPLWQLVRKAEVSYFPHTIPVN